MDFLVQEIAIHAEVAGPSKELTYWNRKPCIIEIILISHMHVWKVRIAVGREKTMHCVPLGDLLPFLEEKQLQNSPQAQDGAY